MAAGLIIFGRWSDRLRVIPGLESSTRDGKFLIL
jgi:hypothetical protein